ncbi:MAG: hypothetical protein KGH93_00750 [Patescibacteria group bacterium]|nr:hypothetical protein [Patescibacteria group bacterium]MDE1945712.1 hypothetical protein [Patescibacteria group bacterium]
MKKCLSLFALVALLCGTGAMADVTVIPPPPHAGKPLAISIGIHPWNDMTYDFTPPGMVADATWSIEPDIAVEYSFDPTSFALEAFFDPTPINMRRETTEGTIPIGTVNFQTGLIGSVYGSPAVFWGFAPKFGVGIQYAEASGQYLEGNTNRWNLLWNLGIERMIGDTFGVSFEYRIPWGLSFDANPPNVRVPWPAGYSSTTIAGEPIVRVLMRLP